MNAAADPLATLASDRVLSIVRAPRIDDAAALSEALVTGGIRVIELTFTTPDLISLLGRAAAAAPRTGAVVGCGTVRTPEQAGAAVEAGARFVVTPGIDPATGGIVEVAHAAGAAVILGAFSPSEVMTAVHRGADVVKIFPARVGGPRYLADLRGPFPDVPLVPSGGVTDDNAGRSGASVVDAGGTGGGGTGGGTAVAAVQQRTARRRPSFVWTLATILAPVVLMLIRAASDVWMSKNAPLYPFLQFIGEPVVALLIAVLLALVTFGIGVGFTASTLTTKLTDSLKPIVSATMIVGAGGGFKSVLVDGGTGVAIGKVAVALSLTALVLGWMVAVLVRLATGSATVATVTASGIVAPLAADLPPTQLALVVLAVGAGSLFFSHVNDAGFWLVKEYFGMTIGQTIKSWSVMETIISVVGLGLTALLSAFL